MGLYISHNTWHGAYSAFMKWREKIAEVSGMPPLELMEGFYSDDKHSHGIFGLLDYAYPMGDELTMSSVRRMRAKLPIKWEALKPYPLHVLLFHEDNCGYISYGNCRKIANELEKLLPLLPDEDAGGHIGKWKDKTQVFIYGLRLAYSKKERVIFR